EAALDQFRRLKDAGCAPRPCEVIRRNAGERREVITKGLLTHSAVTNAGAGWLGIEGVTDSPTLAAAGVDGVALYHGLSLLDDDPCCTGLGGPFLAGSPRAMRIIHTMRPMRPTPHVRDLSRKCNDE